MNNKSSSSSSGFNITFGIILMIIGLIILGAQTFTTFVSVLFLGWMLLIGGAAEFVYSFFSGSWLRFFMYLLIGVFSFIFGLIIITNPALSVATFTLLIGMLLLISGGYKIFSSLLVREENWGWYLVAGIVLVLLGISVLSGWPTTGLWVIGLFIGVEVFINGFLMIASTSTSAEEVRTHQVPRMGGVKGGSAQRTEDDDTDEH